MTTQELVKSLSEASGISGHEFDVSDIISDLFRPYCDSVKKDALGNLIFFKKGKKENSGKIMLAAHMDEIGLMVKDIDEKGFIKFTNIGRIDERILLCQEIIIHGKEKIYGIIGAKPPHLTTAKERSKSIDIDDLIIDTGFSKDYLDKYITIGDVISFKRNAIFLRNNCIAGKSLDDRAGIVALYICLKELMESNHNVDIYFVATVQEEVGLRGAVTSTYNINPDIGIAIDVGFGRTPELDKYDTIELNKGPAITIGANIHPNILNHLKEVAKNNYINYQIEVMPASTGTDAWSMQIALSGVATAVLSIPLRYMHTSVETINLTDVEKTGKLLAKFIISLNNENLEELLCY